MTELQIKYSTKKVSIKIGQEIINDNWTILPNDKRFVVITDTKLTKLYSKKLTNIPNLITIISIKDGELAKSLTVYEKIISTLKKIEFNKNDTIIAFGGGVICDLAGFIASTYLHGVDLIKIPTSLVAQIDASIGGKCSINYQGKNNIGTFYQPSLIIIDLALLKTLSEKEINNGISVMIKYGFIKDISIIEDLQKHIMPFKKEIWESLIERCIKIKTNLTQKDEFGKDAQNILNFGSTFGHVIEINSKFKLSYGESLAIGMFYELSNSDYQQVILELLNKFNLSNNISKWNIDFNEYLKLDKGETTQYITLIDIKKIGNAKLIKK